MLLPLARIAVRSCGEPVHLRLQHWGRLAQDFWRCSPKNPGDDDDTADYIISFKFVAAAALAATAAPATAPAAAVPAAAAPRATARVARKCNSSGARTSSVTQAADPAADAGAGRVRPGRAGTSGTPALA